MKSQEACITPGGVLKQDPLPDAIRRPGTTVTITMDSGTAKTRGPPK